MMTALGSTLVETVSIDYEDFNETYLTCATCLCVFDNLEHTPKLLPCSHTICLQCLDRIVATFARDTGQFRCPICRELITIPRGGVSTLPPSFLVNQLLDLMARQRRQVIPKCGTHTTQELLFCETCDIVFCTLCTGGSHRPGQTSTVAADSGSGPGSMSLAGLSLQSDWRGPPSGPRATLSGASRTSAQSDLVSLKSSTLSSKGGSAAIRRQRTNATLSRIAASNRRSMGGRMSPNSGAHPGEGTPVGDHTVIPFSVAIKRMTEILVYKANECRSKLQKANETVSEEVHRLDSNADETLAAVNACFKALADQVEVKRQQVVEQVLKKRDEKRQVLHEQLEIIQQERCKIDDDVKRSESQVDVRNITKTISELNCKLDTLSNLCEPRENSFIEFNFAGKNQRDLLATVGSNRNSTASADSSNVPATVNSDESAGPDNRLSSTVSSNGQSYANAANNNSVITASGVSEVSELPIESSADFIARISSLLAPSGQLVADLADDDTFKLASAFDDVPDAAKRKSACLVRTSKTFPSLCRAWLLSQTSDSDACPTPGEMGAVTDETVVACLGTSVRVATFDYNGDKQCEGGDPVHADLYVLSADDADELLSEQLATDLDDFAAIASLDAKMAAKMTKVSTECQLHIVDRWDGTYDVNFVPQQCQIHCLKISIFDRPIKDSPLYFSVSEHNSPILKLPSQYVGGDLSLKQPCAVCIPEADSHSVYVLDTGHCRVVQVDAASNFKTWRIAADSAPCLSGQSATGMSMFGVDKLYVVNWRHRCVGLFELQSDKVAKSAVQATHAALVEPIDLTVCGQDSEKLAVADNGASAIFVFAAMSSVPTDQTELTLLFKFGSKGAAGGQFDDLSSIVWTGSSLAVADSRIQFFDPQTGQVERCLASHVMSMVDFPSNESEDCSPSTTAGHGGRYSGLCYDAPSGLVLATRTAARVAAEKASGQIKRSQASSATSAAQSTSVSVVQVFSVTSGRLVSVIDSHGSKLRRPASVAVLPGSRKTQSTSDLRRHKRHVLVADVGTNSVKQYRFQ